MVVDQLLEVNPDDRLEAHQAKSQFTGIHSKYISFTKSMNENRSIKK